MKRTLFCLMFALFPLALCSCLVPAQSGPVADENSFYVSFQNQCDADIYAIHFEYYLNGKAIGSVLCGNANQSAIAKKSLISKDFTPEDFPENADLSSFQLEVFIQDKSKNEYSCGAPLAWEAKFGQVYKVILSGDFQSGFAARAPA